MKLTDLTKRIATLHKVAEKRHKETEDELLRGWVEGYLQALDEVSDYIKREQDIERMEQRLERLKSEQLEEPQPGWSKASKDGQKESPPPANNNTQAGPFTEVTSAHKAA